MILIMKKEVAFFRCEAEFLDGLECFGTWFVLIFLGDLTIKSGGKFGNVIGIAHVDFTFRKKLYFLLRAAKKRILSGSHHRTQAL
jgi:hypothetical protein